MIRPITRTEKRQQAEVLYTIKVIALYGDLFTSAVTSAGHEVKPSDIRLHAAVYQ